MNIDDHKNQKFQSSEANAQIDRLLASWWRTTSQSGLAISPEDIQEMKTAQTTIQAKIGRMFAQMHESAEARRENLQAFSDWKIISVGEDCFSRTVFTRWGIKPSAAFGEKSTPFDLSVHPVASLISLLESDFEGYLDSENLEFSDKLNFCRNLRYRVGFNHETGKIWTENDFEKLKAAYFPRIQRFKDQLATCDKVCFVLHVRNPALTKWANIQKLWRMLQEKSAASEKTMICISTWKHGQAIDTSYHAGISDPDLHLIDANYPMENYVWHRNAHSPEGHDFEKQVIADCGEVLRQRSTARAA